MKIAVKEKVIHAWVVWINEVSVTILSPARMDSTRSKWISIDLTGTADFSILSSPLRWSDKELCVAIFPVTRKPPVEKKIKWLKDHGQAWSRETKIQMRGLLSRFHKCWPNKITTLLINPNTQNRCLKNNLYFPRHTRRNNKHNWEI